MKAAMHASTNGHAIHPTTTNGNTSTTATVALGYVRRSKESGERTVSLDAQRVAIERYCVERGWRLVDVVTHDGISGGRRERLDRIAERVRATAARVVVTYSVDRFARDVAALLDTLRGYSRRGVELHAVGRGHVEVDSEAGFLLTGVEGLMAEAFRRSVSRKTKDALGRLREQGRRISGRAPFGYALGPDGLHLVAEPREQAALALMQQLAPGCSLRVLSAALAARGVLARNGRPFAPMTLARLTVRHRPDGQ